MSSILPLDVLAIAPHPDDGEIGLGGTLASLAMQGLRVGILDLTNGEPTPAGNPKTRAREAASASRELGICWRKCLGLPNRSLDNTLEARWELASVMREVRPAVLFTPHRVDSHPDHVAATDLTEAARFWAKLSKSDLRGEPFFPPKLYYYFSLHLRKPEQPSFILDISSTMSRKLRSVACYESQLQSLSARTADHNVLQDIETRGRYWGWTIGTRFAEPFFSHEMVGLNGLPL